MKADNPLQGPTVRTEEATFLRINRKLYGAVSYNAFEGWNRVAEGRIIRRENQMSRWEGYEQE